MAMIANTPTLEEVRGHRIELLAIAERLGATDLRIFGSVATANARPESDVDFLVRIVADAPGFAYFGLLEALANELGGVLGWKVDVVDEKGLTRERFRKRVLAEAVPL